MSLKRVIPAHMTGALLLALATTGGLSGTGSANAQEPAPVPNVASHSFDIPEQNLGAALEEYARQSGRQIFFAPEAVTGRTARPVSGSMERDAALIKLLEGTGLEYMITPDGGVMVGTPEAVQTYRIRARERSDVTGDTAVAMAATADQDVDPGVAAPGEPTTSSVEMSRRGGIEEIIVTGQKRAERIQDVPIAISAFSMEDLDAQKIEGGFDLLKAIPNVTFSKTNFTGYNFQIRGVGTQSISATSDPAVAVSFNSIAVIQNRLFEQEYLDVERVEVLRGPQGTLYGRNATGGVINVISNPAKLGQQEAMFKIEAGNFDAWRLRGMFNQPIGDSMAIRAAYASTKRDGYAKNLSADDPFADVKSDVDDRDLWTGRLSLAWEPLDNLRLDLMWERFSEDDRRVRSAKQLCHRDDGPDQVGATSVDSPDPDLPESTNLLRRALFSQGCSPGSLFDREAFGTPNGLAYGFVFGANFITTLYPLGFDADGNPVGLLQGGKDPYGGRMQSRDLRAIESKLEPRYRADADMVQLNLQANLGESWTLSSQTAYVKDETYSFQDYNRFNSLPLFSNTTLIETQSFEGDWTNLMPNGEFCDPQLGCTDKLAGFDIAFASAEQFTQEVRLQSSFDNGLNFSLGANYTTFETDIDYYVMYNLITALALVYPFSTPVNGVIDPSLCTLEGFSGVILGPGTPVPSDSAASGCPYIDPNPVDQINGLGHNYYRSRNPYRLESTAVFGELYWNVRDTVKLTAGLRYTNDRKTFTPVPTQVLLAPSVMAGGTVSSGYPELPDIRQSWGEWTGRLVLDWKPDLSITDETLIYASYSRGYKGGGANPPKPGFATGDHYVNAGVFTPEEVEIYTQLGLLPVLELTGAEYGDTFKPEYVNAFELGTKNTLFGGAMTLNAAAFFYDYSDYQVSQIRNRTAVNENFDAAIWGAELEAVIAPSKNFQMLANIGYMKTRIAHGETSIDIMNRTQGNPDYTLVKPWAQLPSNCVVPTAVAEAYLQKESGIASYVNLCAGVRGFLGFFSSDYPEDPATGAIYDYRNYPEINGGSGLVADLGGNELPNSPRWTANIGAQYSVDFLGGSWRATVRGDAYWQDDSYHRVYNLEPYDRLESWYNLNLALKLERPQSLLAIEFYVKNVLDDSPITGAFLNSDDTGLTTNVFTLDPRLIGLSISKSF